MKRVTIAIASPGDVQEERSAVLRVFTNWNDKNTQATLHAKMWEFAAPELGAHPQHILNRKIIETSDLLIAIFWSRLGTPTPTSPSGTVEEIREFINKKGGQRVMVYFCRRPLPIDIDPAELMRLNAFKAETRGLGLYHEYETIEEFEGDLYPHLDVKVEEVLTNEVLLPPIPEGPSKGKEAPNSHPDPQLRNPVDFGTSLNDIAETFLARMQQFQRIDGIGNGNNKYYLLGSHIYHSAAMCLDRFLVYSSPGITAQDEVILQRISTRLKQLADKIPPPSADFRKYWNDGTEIAEDLVAHATHMNKMKKS